MGFIIMKRKERLKKQIASLEIQLAEFLEKAKSQLDSAKKLQNLIEIYSINISLDFVHHGETSSLEVDNYLLGEYLKRRDEYSKQAAENTRCSENIKSEIEILQKKLDSL